MFCILKVVWEKGLLNGRMYHIIELQTGTNAVPGKKMLPYLEKSIQSGNIAFHVDAQQTRQFKMSLKPLLKRKKMEKRINSWSLQRNLLPLVFITMVSVSSSVSLEKCLLHLVNICGVCMTCLSTLTIIYLIKSPSFLGSYNSPNSV